MGWLVLMILLTMFGAAGVVANVNQLRWQRRVAHEMHALTTVKPSTTLRPTIAELPPPVARYRELALGDRAPVRTLKLRHASERVPGQISQPKADLVRISLRYVTDT